MPTIPIRRIVSGFLSIFTGKVILFVATLIITPLLIRVLGSADYGMYAFILAVYSVARVIAGGGVLQGARKYISQEQETHQKQAILGFYIATAIVLGLVIGLAGFLIVWTGALKLFLENRVVSLLSIIVILLAIQPIYYVLRSSLMGFQAEQYSELLPVLDRVVFGITGLLLAWVGFGVMGALYGHLIGLMSAVLTGLYFLRLYVPLGESLTNAASVVNKSSVLMYSGLSVILVLLHKSLYNVDILLLQPFAGSTSTGYYKAALMIAQVIWFIPEAIQMVLLHSSSALWAEKEIENINKVISKITRLTLLMTILTGIGLATLAESFVPLYLGPEFHHSVIPLLLLIPGTIAFAVSRPIFAVGQGKGNLRVLLIATGVAALLNVILNLLLIPMFGIFGAAVATSISYGSMLLFHIISAFRLGFNPLQDLRLIPISTTAMVGGVAIYLLAFSIVGRYLELLLVPPLGFLIYVVCAVVTGAVTISEIKQLASHAI